MPPKCKASHKVKVCKKCIHIQLEHIVDHINDIPIVKEEVFQLSITRHNKKESIVCPICQDPIFHKSPIYKTNCEHKFHVHCFILNAIKGDGTCPVCRVQVISDDVNEEVECLMGHIGRISNMLD